MRSPDDNAWYCAATIYGTERAARSRNEAAWNRWMAGAFEPARRKSFLERWPKLDGMILEPVSPEELKDFSTQFAVRTGNRLSLPSLDKPIIFEDGDLPADIDFYGYVFAPDVQIVSSKAFERLGLARCFFYRTLSLESVVARDAHFDVSVFGNLSLNSCFLDRASFSDAIVDSLAFFKEFRCRSADFSRFRVNRFNAFKAKFGVAGETEYPKVDFSGSRFDGDLDLDGARFYAPLSFDSAKFSGVCSFKDARFHADSSFIDTTFRKRTSFAKAKFRTAVPDFRGAKLHDATEWHGVEWPDPPKTDLDAQPQVYRYERLRQEMERLKKHEDELMFFRKELRARRALVSDDWFQSGLNFAYQLLSGYGESVLRPLFALAAVIAAGAGYFVYVRGFTNILAVSISLMNAFSFLPIRKDAMEALHGHVHLELNDYLVGGAQALASLVLLFLLGLALRNQFRMK